MEGEKQHKGGLHLLTCTDMPISDERLFFAGKLLDDDRTVAEYKIEHGRTLRMNARDSDSEDD